MGEFACLKLSDFEALSVYHGRERLSEIFGRNCRVAKQFVDDSDFEDFPKSQGVTYAISRALRVRLS